MIEFAAIVFAFVFAAGWTRGEARGALGIAVTMTAIVGYMLMTLSPVEKAPTPATEVGDSGRNPHSTDEPRPAQ